jgi:hypothetical protein
LIKIIAKWKNRVSWYKRWCPAKWCYYWFAVTLFLIELPCKEKTQQLIQYYRVLEMLISKKNVQTTQWNISIILYWIIM